MTGAEFDFSELDRWTDVLVGAPARAVKGGYGVVSKGSLNIKQDARRMAPGADHARHYPSSINYDVTVNGPLIEGEIGPVEGRRQWGLGNLLEYGSAHNVPHPHLEPALDIEEPKFIRAAGQLAEEAVHGGGLR